MWGKKKQNMESKNEPELLELLAVNWTAATVSIVVSWIEDIIALNTASEKKKYYNFFFRDARRVEIIEDETEDLFYNDVEDFTLVKDDVPDFYISNTSKYLTAISTREPYMKDLAQEANHYGIHTQSGIVHVISRFTPVVTETTHAH